MARLPRYGESEATITLLKKKDKFVGQFEKKIRIRTVLLLLSFSTPPVHHRVTIKWTEYLLATSHLPDSKCAEARTAWNHVFLSFFYHN